MMPEGLDYISQLDRYGFQNFAGNSCKPTISRYPNRWIVHWHDLIDFEIVPVRTSPEVAELMNTKR
jgi:hypothetical protein